MNPPEQDNRKGLAAQLMIVEVISDLLTTTGLRDVGTKLTEQLRELTGARTVVLLAHRGDSGMHELLHACPDRRANLFSPDELQCFHPDQTPDPLPHRTAELPPEHGLHAVLLRVGVESLLRVPLRVGGELLGVLLLLDLPNVDRLGEVTKVITLLSPPIALALRNAFDYEKIDRQKQEIQRYADELECRVDERTAELTASNEDLVASRLAALNMMEDAVRARERMERMNADLRREMEERSRVEDALRESEGRFRSLVEQAGDGFELLDAEGRYTDVNSATCRQLGYSREELLCLTVFDIDPLVSREQYAAIFQSLVNSPHITFEAMHRRRDGTTFPVEITTSVILLGKDFRALTLVRDISDRKRAEEEREKLRGQLVQAQKMESIGHLAGGVAHDFNNMLGVILGHSEAALDRMEPAQPLRTHLEEIQKAAQRSADLTRQLLAFARKQTVAPKVLDLNDTVAGMLKMIRRLIGEDIDLAWMPGSDVRPVKIDPAQIDQLLVNLCVNARDAIAGEGKVTIETANVTFDETYCADRSGFVPGTYVMFAVSDSGIGMDKEVLDHIFEPFFTTKGVGKGTGMGLATVYGIVKQNEGFINVYSEPSGGTTFKIYLPSCATEAVPLPAEQPPAAVKPGTETILLVEDEEMLLELGKNLLEGLGYTVLSTMTPDEAIRLSETYVGEIHLLVTDVVLQGMNGRELSERIRTIKPGLRCLFMSGYTVNVIAHRGVLNEGVQFIQKPFSIRNFAAKVREALEQE